MGEIAQHTLAVTRKLGHHSLITTSSVVGVVHNPPLHAVCVAQMPRQLSGELITDLGGAEVLKEKLRNADLRATTHV